jgi:hypothetical protein
MSSAEVERQVADRAVPRWRFLISPRWLGWHALAIVLICGMLALGYWQYRRAMEGNALSWAYTFEWPIFAIFGVVFWIKTIRDEFSPPETDEAPDRPELAVGQAASGAVADLAAAARPLPFTNIPSAEDEAEDAELAAYNAYLARLHEQVKGHGRWHGLR